MFSLVTERVAPGCGLEVHWNSPGALRHKARSCECVKQLAGRPVVVRQNGVCVQLGVMSSRTVWASRRYGPNEIINEWAEKTRTEKEQKIN